MTAGMRAWMLFLLLACASGLAQARAFTAEVIAVFDGDTVLVRQGGGTAKVRLAEIDAPEKDQQYGTVSQQSLAGMVLHKQVHFEVQAVDRYGRLLAHLSAGGLDVNTEQIRRGMAWEYSDFHRNKALVALQEDARRAALGLWAQDAPTPPWEWRKLHPPFSQPASSAALPDASCGGKKRCAEMASCEEARHYFAVCGVKSLDGNGNGVPCEALCGSKK